MAIRLRLISKTRTGNGMIWTYKVVGSNKIEKVKIAKYEGESKVAIVYYKDGRSANFKFKNRNEFDRKLKKIDY